MTNARRLWNIAAPKLAIAALAILPPAVVLALPGQHGKAAHKPAVKQAAGQAVQPVLAQAIAEDEVVSYDRDVRPIIAENCFACHGPDASKRQAGLRLDTPQGAFEKLADGKTAVVQGNLTASELVRRINALNGDKMPPPSSGKRLKRDQIELLTRWVAQGGKYQDHWAFITPKRPALPKLPAADAKWCRNPIDYFVMDRLRKNGLKPSPEADRRTLIRRVTLDLTGLPPTLAEVNAFLADKSPNAYEKVVDRLLASPHYGERMALHWLDLARYADTHGYHIDSGRQMFRWRDWVIDAYNKNMPYDEFTVEQLAGDMLPNATLDQKIASGFNRNHPIDFEGGAIPEEYAAAYIFDRIDTTSTVFMGLTMRCGQCHDHKYDPLTNRDYYRFYALFNNVPEQGLDGQKGNAVPFIKAPYPEQAAQLAAYTAKVKDLDEQVKSRTALLAPQETAWEKTATANPASLAPEAATTGLVAEYPLDEGSGGTVRDRAAKMTAGAVVGKAEWAPGKVGQALKLDGMTAWDLGQGFAPDRTDKFSYGAWIYPTSGDAMTVVSKMDDANAFRGFDIYLTGGNVFVHLIHHWDDNAIRVNTKTPVAMNQWSHVFVTYDGSSKAKGVHVYVNGKPVELDVTHDKLTDTIKTDKPLRIGRRHESAPFKGMIDEVRFYSRELAPAEVQQLVEFDGIRQALATAADKRTTEQKSDLSRYYLEHNDPTYRTLSTELADWRKKETDLDAEIPTTMVMEEMKKPRDTFILVRGQYDKKGDKVTPGVPAIFEQWEPDRPVHNRLDFARWLVDPRNPLTARVAINRYWMLFFGSGIVRTPEDFGTQGEWPTHPRLLDWLASEFEKPGRWVAGSLGPGRPNDPATQRPDDPRPWDVKHMVRLIVTSATYRQSSKATPDLLEKDPENRLLARGPRFRLTAEFIRDQALAVSGLLVPRIGGPSVKPYQPAGLWEEMSFKGGFSEQYYVQDHGDKLYRRSMYTFWKRTVPPPSLQTFDAPNRESCVVRRSVTNTPLQALVLMNDPTYVEASRKFAERILTEGGATPKDRLRFAFLSVLCREPRRAESAALLDLYAAQLATLKANPEDAKKLLSVGESPRNEKLDPVELAAWTEVASTILNMDETVTKE